MVRVSVSNDPISQTPLIERDRIKITLPVGWLQQVFVLADDASPQGARDAVDVVGHAATITCVVMRSSAEIHGLDLANDALTVSRT